MEYNYRVDERSQPSLIGHLASVDVKQHESKEIAAVRSCLRANSLSLPLAGICIVVEGAGRQRRPQIPSFLCRERQWRHA